MWFVFLGITAGSVSVKVQSEMRSNKEPDSVHNQGRGCFNDQRL